MSYTSQNYAPPQGYNTQGGYNSQIPQTQPYNRPPAGGAPSGYYGATPQPQPQHHTGAYGQPQPQHHTGAYGQPQPQHHTGAYGQPQPQPQHHTGAYGPPQPQHQTGAYGPPQTSGYYGSQQSYASTGPQGWYNQYYTQIPPQQMQEYQKWFQAVDRDGSNSISARELEQLSFGGHRLGFETALKLVKVFDKDRNGEIDFKEYATLHQFLSSMQQVFAQSDIDRNGILDCREIHTALQRGGFQLAYHAVEALFRKQNKENAPGINFPKFLDMAADIALMRSQFEWRDSDRDGYITIRLDDLLAMCADV